MRRKNTKRGDYYIYLSEQILRRHNLALDYKPYYIHLVSISRDLIMDITFMDRSKKSINVNSILHTNYEKLKRLADGEVYPLSLSVSRDRCGVNWCGMVEISGYDLYNYR